jgi:glycosyltransferase involved in cell wall biosynthesis
MLIPSYIGSTGDAVNERQMVWHLCRKLHEREQVKCIVFAQIGISKLIRLNKRVREVLERPLNTTLVFLPLPMIPLLLYLIVSSLVSFSLALMVQLFSLIKGDVRMVYVRGSWNAVGFTLFKKTRQKLISKIPAIIEDEVPNSNISKFFIGKIASFMDRTVLAKAKKIAVNSRTFYNGLIRRRSLPRNDEPLIISAGVNLSLIEKVKGQISRSPLKNMVDVGFIGSPSWWQGVDILVRAIALLREKTPNLKVVIIGDGELRRPIEELCKSLDIPYEITGFIPHEEALKRLGTLDVMVLPSRRFSTTELNIPIKVVEAWALGVPIIVTKHQVFLDYQIRDYEDVIYCEPEPNSVANAIHTLLTNDELRKKLEINGSKLAKQFDYNKIAERLLRAIRDKANFETQKQ